MKVSYSIEQESWLVRIPSKSRISYASDTARLEALLAEHPDAEVEHRPRRVRSWTETESGRAGFGDPGSLPVPEGCPQVDILPHNKYMCHPLDSELVSKFRHIPVDGTEYSFVIDAPGWSDWFATDGSEDCECGSCYLSGQTLDGTRYLWYVLFVHDGTPQVEFWGAKFSSPDRVH